MEPGDRGAVRDGWVTLGRGVTHGEALPLGRDDPVIAARAVRRALADAGRRATDVVALVLACPEAVPPDVLRAFARRALGPFGETVPVASVAAEGPAERIADAGAERLAAAGRDAAAGLVAPQDGVLVAVAVGADGTTVARCLGRRRPNA
jgi:hypothetical protein